MSTTATPIATLKPSHKIPKTGLNPFEASAIVCPERTCHKIIHPKSATEDPGTGQLMVYYECPKCGYGFRRSPGYVQGAYCAPQAPTADAKKD